MMQKLIKDKLDSPESQMRIVLKLNRKLPKLKLYQAIYPEDKYPKKTAEVESLIAKLKLKEGETFSLI
jgi:hypothetical protein